MMDEAELFNQNPDTQSRPLTMTFDMTEYIEVEFKAGEHFVKTTPEHLIECLSWLLTNVDTDTVITKEGVDARW